MNIRLTLEYDGEPYLGWQVQPQGPTIQSELEKAIQKISSETAFVRGAGRTDAGVHAKAQVGNFKTSANLPPDKWAKALNSVLPPTIRVVRSEEMPEAFDALRDARAKIYEYRVLNRPIASALDRKVYYYPGRLDWSEMAASLPCFLGKRDFKCFQAAGSAVKTTVRTIHRFELEEGRDGIFRFEIEGSGFLKQMVRAIVGTVMEVGEGRRTLESIAETIASCDRRKAGRTAPASGLCLVKVIY